MQGDLFDESHQRTHPAVELGALGQDGKGVPEARLGVAIEVPFAGESGEAGEDGEGHDLTVGDSWLGSGLPFRRTGFVEVVDCDVKCGEEVVLKSSMRSRFLSLRDW